MALRSRSVVTEIPWCAYLALAIIVYPLMKYMIPLLMQGNSHDAISKALATNVMPSLAPIMSGSLIFTSIILAYNAWKRGELFRCQNSIETLRTISWREFEELIAEVYKRKGYNVTETGGSGADGGVDLILKKGGEILFVQCKHWRMERVGVKVVRELYGVMAAEGASGGIVISSGLFTQEAQEFTRGKSLELIDGNELVRIIAEVKNNPNTLCQNSIDNMCPKCGKSMVLRTAKKGANPGEKFWGCSEFPKCRGTKPFNQ